MKYSSFGALFIFICNSSATAEVLVGSRLDRRLQKGGYNGGGDTAEETEDNESRKRHRPHKVKSPPNLVSPSPTVGPSAISNGAKAGKQTKSQKAMSKSSKMGKSSKTGGGGASSGTPTKSPSGSGSQTPEPTSSSIPPTNIPEARIRMTIPSTLYLNNIASEDGSSIGSDSEKALADTIEDVAEGGLSEGQSVSNVRITSIDGVNDDVQVKWRALQESTYLVQFDLVLDEVCGLIRCEELVYTTMMYDDVTSHITEEVENGGFDATLQENVEGCGEACDDLVDATAARVRFDPEITEVLTDMPTAAPTLSIYPNPNPTFNPTINPTSDPTFNPVTSNPTISPVTSDPTSSPNYPTYWPTYSPTINPTLPTLEPSPSCIPGGYTCLQNSDFGVEDTTKYKMDISIETLDPANADAYVAAKVKWMGVITGDLVPIPSSAITDDDDCVNSLPEVIDDLHICGVDAVIDGPGGILGSAGPLWWNVLMDEFDQLLGVVTISGNMKFDIADIQFLVEQGIWEGVIRHEMAHVIGIGTFWEFLVVDENLDYYGPKATNVWQNDWGCVGTPPVEKDFGPGTRGGHWDEDCLVDELMTGFANPGAMPLSNLTIASLEDIGYTVDYSVAEEYDGSDTTCCFGNSNNNMALSKPTKPPLSKKGLKKAISYGQKVLSKKQRPSEIGQDDEKNGLMYVGDRFISILIEENGYIYDVHVTRDMK